MIAVAFLVLLFASAGTAIKLGTVPHLQGHRLHAVVALSLVAQVAMIGFPAAILCSM